MRGLNAHGLRKARAAHVLLNEMVGGLRRFKETEQNVEQDAFNADKYVKEIAKLSQEMLKAIGRIISFP